MKYAEIRRPNAAVAELIKTNTINGKIIWLPRKETNPLFDGAELKWNNIIVKTKGDWEAK